MKVGMDETKKQEYLEVIAAKNRNGPVGTVKPAF